MARILVEGLYEEVQEPNERELALVDAYAQRNPGEISQIYGLELPLLQEDRVAFLKRFFFEPAQYRRDSVRLSRTRSQNDFTSRS